MPPPAEGDQRRERPPAEDADRPARREHVHRQRRVGEPLGPDRRPATAAVRCPSARRTARTSGTISTPIAVTTKYADHDQPELPRPPQVVGQRRWLAARAAASEATRAGMRGWSICAGVSCWPRRVHRHRLLSSDRLYPGGTREAVRPEPPARHVGRRRPVGHRGVHLAQVRCAQQRGHGVQRIGELRAERLERRLRDDRRDVLRGLQVAIVAAGRPGRRLAAPGRSRTAARCRSSRRSSACAVSGPPASSAMYSLKCKPYTSSRPLRQSGRCSHSAGPPNVIPGANDVRSLNRSTLRLAAVVAEIAKELRSSAGAAPSAVSPRGASCDRELLMRGGGIARGRAPRRSPGGSPRTPAPAPPSLAAARGSAALVDRR